MKYLIENGADVDWEDYQGRRALHWAAKYDDMISVSLLVDRGANIDARDRWAGLRLCGLLKVHNKSQ